MAGGGVRGGVGRPPRPPAARPLPLVMLVIAALAVVDWYRVRNEPEPAASVVRVALAVLALVLLAKLGLYVRLFHYGFALAMPATLMLVAALVSWLPAAVARAGGDRGIVRAVGVGLVVAGVAAYVAFAERSLRMQTTRIGTGVDEFLADDRGSPIALALAEIERRV